MPTLTFVESFLPLSFNTPKGPIFKAVSSLLRVVEMVFSEAGLSATVTPSAGMKSSAVSATATVV